MLDINIDYAPPAIEQVQPYQGTSLLYPRTQAADGGVSEKISTMRGRLATKKARAQALFGNLEASLAELP
ncbi:MAG: hypothetical protein J0L97_07690 [Alphaproteobacteria bacterium]|nr:hypothetical protein [Alphaproteobacteria bacterium]